MPCQATMIRFANRPIINVGFFLLLWTAWPVLGQGQITGDSQALSPNQKLERSLKGGEVHSYGVKLNAGEYLHVDVEQRGIDVVLLMVDADGKTLVERDRPNGARGQESLSFIATASGKYRLAVRALGEKVAAGDYEIKSEIPRQPTVQDKKRIEAENISQEGLRLVRRNTIESVTQACEKYEAAAALWRDVGDMYAEALIQTNLSYSRERLDQWGKAVMAHERAALLFRELNDKQSEASALTVVGNMNRHLGENRKALDYFGQALALWQALGNKSREATVLNNIGTAHIDLGENRKALDSFSRALPLVKGAEDARGEAIVRNNMGLAYYNLSENQKALESYFQALSFYVTLADKENIADTLNNIGLAYSNLGEKQKALDYFNRALPLRKEVGDKDGEADTLLGISLLYSNSGENQKAIETFRQALSLYIELNDKKNAALTLGNIGIAYFNSGEHRKAIETFNQALSLFIELDDKQKATISLNSIGMAYSGLNEISKALEYYNQAAFLAKKIKDKSREAAALQNIGTTYSTVGEYQQALEYLNRALLLLREARDKSGEALTLSSIGDVYFDLGEKQKALKYYNQALALHKEVQDKSNEAATLSALGRVYADLGRGQEALDSFMQSLHLSREIKDKSGEAVALNNIGRSRFESGQYQSALEYFNQSLRLPREIGKEALEAANLNNIAFEYLSQGDRRQALDYFTQALILWKAAGDKLNEAKSLNNLMFIWYNLNNPRQAAFYGKQAANIYQQLRGKVQGLDQTIQKTFLQSAEHTYRGLLKLLISQERLAEALQALNAFKDQQYFDLNPETLKKPSPLVFTQREAAFEARCAAVSDKIGNIRGKIEELKRTIGLNTPSPAESAKLRHLEADFGTATEEYLSILKQAEIEFKQTNDSVKDKASAIDDVREMQKVLRKLGQKTIAVYTVVGEHDFYALIVTPDDLTTISSPIRSDKLNDKAKQLWALLQSDEYDPKLLSKEIYDLVFKPIKDKFIAENKLEKVLPEGATIMWLLDSNLRYLPMAALYDGEKYLVERYNNVVFTRADSERWTRAVSPHWTGVGFGSSRGGNIEYLKIVYPFDDLPNVAEELNAVFRTNNSQSGVFQGDIFPDLKFTREAMITALKQHRPLVHISSHFRFAPGNEDRSFLLLGDSTVFPLNEMKQRTDLFQGVELLTLSACETAAQWPDSDGREVDAFAELAQRQGAGAVMAALWKVRDDSTYWLMRDFYQRKRDMTKQTKSESLRQAQIALLNGTAKVKPSLQTRNANAKKGSGNSTVIKILPEGKESPPNNDDGVVYVEAKYAIAYNRSDSKPYAHPYFWSPFILFGNWR
jgi:CHAT domain-containing protein/Tfp pilus assembly protein PilF